MQNPIRILLIEAQALIRIGIREIVSTQKDLEIVGEAESGAKGFELFQLLKPDVTILSLRLPDLCAIDVLDDYFAENRKAKIIVLAEHAGDAEISKSLKKGALGFLCRDVSESDLVKAIRAIASGKKYLPNEITGILSENFGREELTRAEQKILFAIVSGKSNKEIAFDSHISENTVKTHVKNIFDKLGVSDRTSAATLAIKRGLVRIDL